LIKENTLPKRTYAELQSEITRLQEEAEAVRQEELDGVIARIREAIAFYGLTPRDLGFSSRAASGDSAPKRRGRPPKSAAKSIGGGAQRAPKYRDTDGNVWSGRGPRPKWLRDAIGSGKRLEEFAIR
jgi:DNA-binding protein H-NS